MGEGKSSRTSSLSYSILHVNLQIEVGGVTGSSSSELSCSSSFQLRGIEERRLQYCKKLHLSLNWLQKEEKGRKWPSLTAKRSERSVLLLLDTNEESISVV